ncbi:TPR-REGION domain-containing protein [Mycena sanguinolenta]|uniref:TPR-REGION domain-containing protein n=1 Tax=Mycena sanguinolenta TaxID=230812 RepID=A0A8H6Y7Q8_9AGAR|nr:TPR-REGION domain-containing protein [Mycena sanguinolenta]
MTAPQIALIETALLTGKWDSDIGMSEATDLAKSVVDGDFGAALRGPFAKKLFAPSTDANDTHFNTEITTYSLEDDTIRLILAVACLHSFIQVNWTGPELDFESRWSPVYASNPELAGRLELEQGLLQHFISQDKLAAEYFIKAARSTGLEYELTGALGKRTKFQTNDLSQLILLAESKLKIEEQPNSSSAELSSTGGQVPETLALNDDTLLEQTAFTSSSASAHSQLARLDPSAQPALHPLDQSILLAMCLNIKNTSPVHGLTAEQMTPYVSRGNLASIKLANRTRTVERATLQLQALIEQMPTADAPVAERLRYAHALPLPSKWEMEKELATRFLSLGAVRSALDIFERLEMWEEVVKCWQAMERRDMDVVLARGKAGTTDARRANMDLAREAKLWCLLGDLEPENAADHYQRAWTVSGQTAGRAMRSLGGYHFARAEYPEAIASLKKAVGINPLLSRSWFILGCACMRVEDWAEAKADDDAKDTAAVPFENKLLAFRALKQGLRSAYENWRMWYNYMIVAVEVGELSEACRALGRVIEHRGAEGLDEDVLELLVTAVTRAPTTEETEGDASDVGCYAPVKHLLEDIVLPRISSSPRVFRAYARLLVWECRWDDALKASMDAYRCSTAGTMERGETDIKKWREAIPDVEDIVDALQNFGPRSQGDSVNWRLQARSIVRTFMGKTKDSFEDEPEWGK